MAEMYADRVACCPLVSHNEYVDARHGQRKNICMCVCVFVCVCLGRRYDWPYAVHEAAEITEDEPQS